MSDREQLKIDICVFLNKSALHGTRVAMYIVGQEETAGESSVSVVAGVRTVTTNMDGRDVLPRLSRPSAFSIAAFNSKYNQILAEAKSEPDRLDPLP